jgi:hypothetical protein
LSHFAEIFSDIAGYHFDISFRFERGFRLRHDVQPSFAGLHAFHFRIASSRPGFQRYFSLCFLQLPLLQRPPSFSPLAAAGCFARRHYAVSPRHAMLSPLPGDNIFVFFIYFEIEFSLNDFIACASISAVLLRRAGRIAASSIFSLRFSFQFQPASRLSSFSLIPTTY